MDTHDLLTVGAVADRSGFAPSALRYYERMGLIEATRTSGNQRRYPRSGLRLDEVADALATLPDGRPPPTADWARLSRSWRARLDDQIAGLLALRDGLDSCIGCGCLSLRRCAFSNPADLAARAGPGAAYLPSSLRRRVEDDRT